jgi:hypothetical protein
MIWKSRSYIKTCSHTLKKVFSQSAKKNYPIANVLVDTYNKPKQFTFEANRSLEIPNAGGDSVISEMYSIDKLQRSLNLMHSKCILEKEVRYWIDYKMVDYILKSKNRTIGVSVTRSMSYNTLNFTKAFYLLNKKIKGIDVAKNCVVDEHNFDEKIVHIWCKNNEDADQLVKASKKINWDGLLWITVANFKEIYEKTR